MVDKRFDEIVIKEINLKIAEAFLELETNVRMNKFGIRKSADKKGCEFVKIKANQMKTEINAFIDSQVKRIIGLSECQEDIGHQSFVEQVEKQSQ